MTSDAVAQRITIHASQAANACLTIVAKNITPHVLRHYVDGWVMWPAAMFPVAGVPLRPVPAT